MKTNFPEALYDIDAAFFAFNVPIRLVGGAVRDVVMGKQPKDYDLATPAKPEETMRILNWMYENRNRGGAGRPFDLSNGHGTISIIIDGETYEITTLRVDAETDGRHAKVEFVEDFRLDAARRDFTINAMSMTISTEQLFDYFGGQQDIKDKVIRFVGDAEKRIQEDYLRILRFFRFAARYEWKMDINAVFAIEKNVEGLKEISGERIWMEIQQICRTPKADDYIEDMRTFGVWDILINR